MNIKPLGILAIVFVTLGAIIAFVPKDTTKHIKVGPANLLNEIKSGTQYMSNDEVADLIVKKDPTIQLIDVRNPTEFEKFSLPGAVNIPMEVILNPEWEETLNQDVKTNILYSNGTVQSNEAWMMLRQLGYENNYVLQGGLNYWFDKIMNPEKPSDLNPDEEFAKYEFRVGASKALGGGDTTAVKASTNVTAPKTNNTGTEPKKKKKGASGGC